jgi:predicted methyltransferase
MAYCMKHIFVTGTAILLCLSCQAQPGPEPKPTAAAPAPTPAPPSAEELKKAEADKAAEQKKAEEQKKLEQDYAELKANNEKELARWTPELRANAKTVAEKKYPNGKAAIAAALAAKYRKPGNAERDKQRHPAETLAFFGFEPKQTVLEYGPGEGWYTELLAPALAQQGKLIVTNTDPNGAKTERSTFYGQRFKLFTDSSPELYSKVETALVDSKAPDLKLDGTVDLVIVMRGLHGMVNAGTLDKWLSEFHSALKPKGVLGIEQHRANADAKPEESAKKGYLPQEWVIGQVQAAGFKLLDKSEINANPKDTKDYPGGVWTLPPSFAQKDQDREKYAAIGESDRMTLKFEKVSAAK